MTGDERRVRVPETPASGDPVEGMEYGDLTTREVIGTGGNATVHEAVVEGVDRRIALKEPYLSDPGETVTERFREEADTWARLDDHDNVVDVLDWGTDPHPWIAMECMDGGTLRDCDPGVAESLWIGVRLADAVHHAHRHGVAHLDLKPDNVLFRRVEGSWDVPKIADWGLAQLLIEGTRNLEGISPRYAAPEQFDPDRFGDPDDRTDVYQLGALVYRLLTGDPPYAGPPRAVMEAACSEEIVAPPTDRDPALPGSVDAVLERALATEKADRYESVLDLRRDLETVLADLTDYEPIGAPRELAATPRDGDETTTTRSAVIGSTIELESQGFVRLTPSYFERREPAPPLRAWRAGLRLVDVHHGYAVGREIERDCERVDLTAHLLDRLAGGTDTVLVGESGAGKSTVLKTVACEWYERERGPVLYRESGRSDRLDSAAALKRHLDGTDGHTLVAVEDAVRDEASAIFEVVEAVEGRSDVTVLLDARRTEWEEGTGVGAESQPIRRRATDPVYLPRPDEREYGRFVDAFERTVEASVPVPTEELLAEIREARGTGTRAGELYLLIHRLVESVSDDRDATSGTPLDDRIRETYDDFADEGTVAFDVCVAANLLNVAGIGVHPELLHAVAPEEETAVAEAVDALDDRVLFGRTGGESGQDRGPYRTVHEAWSTAFLDRLIDVEGQRDAHERFGRVLTRILALADDADLRERIDWILHGETPYLDRIERDPDTWVESVVEATYRVGIEVPKLARLFGEADYSRVELPDSGPERLQERVQLRRARAFVDEGQLGAVERELEPILEEFEGEPENQRDRRFRIRALYYRSSLDVRREAHAAASDYAEEALSLATDLDAPELTGRLHQIVGVCYDDPEVAMEHQRKAIDAYERAGNEKGVAECLTNLGSYAHRQRDLDEARELYERALDHAREAGNRKVVSRATNHLGVLYKTRGEFEVAERHLRRALQAERNRGDRRSRSETLVNLANLLNQRLDVSVADVDPAEYEEVAEYYRRARRLAEETSNLKARTLTTSNLLATAVRSRNLDRAEELLSSAREAVEELGSDRRRVEMLDSAALLSMQNERYEEARNRAHRGLEIARENGFDQLRTETLGTIGQIAHHRGETGEAREHLAEAIELAETAEDVLLTLQYLPDLVDVLESLDEYEAAVERCDQGATVAEACGLDSVASEYEHRRTELVEARNDRA